MGASSVVTIALSIVRQKFIAVTLGAEGVGLLGLLVTGLTLAVTLFGVGLASSGVRYVAKAKEGDEAEFLNTRSALVYGSQVLGLLGCALFVLFRAPLAALILDDPTKASWMVWLGVALWAAVGLGWATRGHQRVAPHRRPRQGQRLGRGLGYGRGPHRHHTLG